MSIPTPRTEEKPVTQQYVATKIVTAWPTGKMGLVKVCGVDCHQGQDGCNGYCTGDSAQPERKPDIEGYSVRYEDGYMSWCPKDVFEAANLPLGTIEQFPPHVQRVIAEKAQLDDRIAKLTDWLGRTAGTDIVSEQERKLMNDQCETMSAYSAILGERLKPYLPAAE